MWTDALTPLRWLARGLLLLGVVVLLVPTLVVLNPLGRAIRFDGVRLDERMINLWAGALCRAFGVRLRVRGQVQDGPVMIVANHISWLDIPLLHSLASMGFVGKAEINDWPLIGFMARAAETVFIRRGNHDSSAGVARTLLERLKAGRRVAIFPEGGIRPGDGVKVFHARLFAPAVDADSPVQPVMIRYLRDGRHDTDMTFIGGESFLVNLVRLLGKPGCTAEVDWLEPLGTGGRPRKDVARQAQEMVEHSFSEGV